MELPVRVLAVVGRNPAPLAQLLWCLANGGGERVVEVRCVVLGGRAADHLRKELLGPAGALAQMRATSNAPIPDALEVEIVEGDAGQACWEAAKALTAKREAVRFAAFPGRQRRASLELASCFNFLGRQRDEVMDVEVLARGSDGVTGFYFPGQPSGRVVFPDGSVHEASALELRCRTVPLPRLRRLLPALAEGEWEMVATLGMRGLDALAGPNLVVDLESGTAEVGGIQVKLAPLPLAWLAALARARCEGDDGGWLYSDSTAALAEVLVRCAHQPWVKASKTRLLRKLIKGVPGEALDGKSAQYLARVRHLVRQKLQRVARMHFPLFEARIVPEVGQGHSHGGPDHRQRLPLSPECIHLHGM